MKRVLVILPNGFEIFEAAAFIDVLGWADRSGSEKIEYITAGVSSSLQCTFGDYTFKPGIDLRNVNVDDFDAVAIPGGFTSAGFQEEGFSELVLQTFIDFNKRDKIIASICVAALVLGKSGILKNRRATTYNYQGDKVLLEKLSDMGAIVEDTPIVVDKNIITSSSPGTAIDVAFKLLELLTSLNNANLIRGMMKFD